MSSLKELKIVIAEDSKLLGNLISRSLSSIDGFRIAGLAENGVEALELVRAYKPHVLVLDISMPFKDGIKVLEEVRAEDSAIVIIMFTANESPFARKACLDLGANYFLDKSQISELIEICNLHLLAL
ncbi:MAG: response regulator transcription factor [Pyrinomonadaceae bacterium]